MSPQFQRLTGPIAATLVVAAFAASTAMATDLRSPDTRDAVFAAHKRTAPVDLRSPDTRDAPNAIGNTDPGSLAVDLRSPDTRGVAAGRLPATSTGSVEVKVIRPGVFDWSDAGVGAAAGAGFVLLLVGTSLLLRRARTEPRPV